MEGYRPTGNSTEYHVGIELTSSSSQGEGRTLGITKHVKSGPVSAKGRVPQYGLTYLGAVCNQLGITISFFPADGNYRLHSPREIHEVRAILVFEDSFGKFHFFGVTTKIMPHEKIPGCVPDEDNAAQLIPLDGASCTDRRILDYLIRPGQTTIGNLEFSNVNQLFIRANRKRGAM